MNALNKNNLSLQLLPLLAAVAVSVLAGCSQIGQSGSSDNAAATPPQVMQTVQDNGAKQAAWIQSHPGQMPH